MKHLMKHGKHNKLPPKNTQKTATASPLPATTHLSPSETDFAPSPDEVARRAYFNYVNQGAQPGRDVQHWLEAEKQLVAERNLTRVHGFHYRT
jgi:hypothetical protein